MASATSKEDVESKAQRQLLRQKMKETKLIILNNRLPELSCGNCNDGETSEIRSTKLLSNKAENLQVSSFEYCFLSWLVTYLVCNFVDHNFNVCFFSNILLFNNVFSNILSMYFWYQTQFKSLNVRKRRDNSIGELISTNQLMVIWKDKCLAG